MVRDFFLRLSTLATLAGLLVSHSVVSGSVIGEWSNRLYLLTSGFVHFCPTVVATAEHEDQFILRGLQGATMGINFDLEAAAGLSLWDYGVCAAKGTSQIIDVAKADGEKWDAEFKPRYILSSGAEVHICEGQRYRSESFYQEHRAQINLYKSEARNDMQVIVWVFGMTYSCYYRKMN